MLGALLAGYMLGSPSITIRPSRIEVSKPRRLSKKERREIRDHDNHLKKCPMCKPSKSGSYHEMDTIFY